MHSLDWSDSKYGQAKCRAFAIAVFAAKLGICRYIEVYASTLRDASTRRRTDTRVIQLNDTMSSSEFAVAAGV